MPLDFDAAFAALTGNPPFPWQTALYKRFENGDIPASCNLPTGLGKTSVIAVWLIAHANGCAVPRRLVYVVNRRTVVDQTTDEVKRYRDNSAALDLKQPLAISTLRGQFADNREWSADPSRPAVICGTVDMIGSRLLFGGYGCSFKTRPLHAGFLGQDALIVHDEAHLEPAFQELLLAIENEQRYGRTPDFRPLRVMELTATSRAGGEAFPNEDEKKENDAHSVVQKRVGAMKKLHLIPSTDDKKLAEQIATKAKECGERYPGSAVILFVRSVNDVDAVTKKLPPNSFEKLTGTLRGYERDGLVKRPIFQRFLPDSNRDNDIPPVGGTVYLVCTSAGEVGVNISADHLVCDLSTFESMAQRFGRVNRFGDRDDTEIHVVHPTEFDDEKPPEQQMKATLALLRELPKYEGGLHNASPSALGALDPQKRAAAFTPPPVFLPASDILFDSWALTTINMPLVKQPLPGRPHVELYLHGIQPWQPLETHVAWREEVGEITGALLANYEPELMLDEYPLKPHELLRDRTDRVFDRLKKLKAPKETPVWVVDEDDTVGVTTLGDLIDAGKDVLARKTVLLPPRAGGLSDGFLDADSPDANDVSGGEFYRNERGEARRVRVWGEDPVPDNMRRVLTIDTKPDTEDDDEETGKRYWRWYELRLGDDEGITNSKKPVLWTTHTDDVVNHTTGIVGRLLTDDLQRLFVLAARCHDLGKRRKLFQTVLGNANYPTVELAKSGKKGGRIAEKYRHEFGSLLDVQADREFAALTDDDTALVLHLIAAHHGRARPHFPADEAFDPERPADAAAAVARGVPQRFARLQRKYGRWGLAYLESLLRAADYAASASPSKFVEGDE